MARRPGLGRGLDALIPSQSQQKPIDVVEDGHGLRNLETKLISPNPNQPRIHFDEDALSDLAASIAAVGVLQPILVRNSPSGKGHYEIIAGERRWRAAQRAGLTVIPALVRETDDVSSVEQALIENLHRQDLTPLEEAAAYKQLLDDFAMTHEQVSEKVGKTRSAVTNSLRLLSLPPSIQQLLADGRLSGGHARALLGLADRATQELLAKRCANEGLTVRAVEDEVRKVLGRQSGSKNKSTKDGTKNKVPGGEVREAGVVELERLLGEHLATNVAISLVSGKGRVVVEFADLADLERIYRTMTDTKAHL